MDSGSIITPIGASSIVVLTSLQMGRPQAPLNTLLDTRPMKPGKKRTSALNMFVILKKGSNLCIYQLMNRKKSLSF